MRYEVDGEYLKACIWCMDGEESPDEFVLDIEAGLTRCVYCESANTRIDDWSKGRFKCLDCEELFYNIIT